MFFLFPFNQLMWPTTKRPNVRLFAFLCLCGPFTLFRHLSHPCLCMIHFSSSFKSSFHWPACWQWRQTLPMSLTGPRLVRLRANEQASFHNTEKGLVRRNRSLVNIPPPRGRPPTRAPSFYTHRVNVTRKLLQNLSIVVLKCSSSSRMNHQT